MKDIRNLLIYAIIIASYSCKESGNSIEQVLYQLKLENSQLLISEVATNLVEPWEITWGPDDHIWFTEHRGYVSRMDPETGKYQRLLKIPNLHYERTSGVLGMVLHPDFQTDPYVYVHYTIDDPTPDDPDRITSEVVRFLYHSELDTLTHPDTILADIPGQPWHNGSRMIITPDRKIILATGDIGDDEAPQDPSKLNGKTLRINLDGSIPDDNPYENSYLYSIGHRNAQGLVYANDRIYSSEHGPNNDDEVNIVKASQNYGWPDVEGFCDTEHEVEFCGKTKVTEPLTTWTPTIAPSGLDYFNHPSIPEWQNSLILTSLKARSLRVLQLSEDGDHIIEEEIYFQKLFGRFRDVCISSAGDIYLSTSNTDWHPISQVWMYDSLPREGDDRIIKISANIPPDIDTNKLLTIRADTAQMQLFDEDYETMAQDNDLGTSLYVTHCATCHLPNGTGIPNLIPPLSDSEWITGDRERLIEIILRGITGKIEVAGQEYNEIMPGFAALLSDQEIADILNFVTAEFGDGGPPLNADDVYNIRSRATYE